MPIKFLHVADTHIGVENYGRLDSGTGLHTRLQDFIKSLRFAFEEALKENVDLVIFAGDAYRSCDPTPTHQREFASLIRMVSAEKIPVVMVTGNHDNPVAFGKASSVDIFGTLGTVFLGGALFQLFVVHVQLRNRRQTGQGFTVAEADQTNTLGVAAQMADFVHAGAHQGALVGDQHDVLIAEHLGGAHQRAVTLVDHHADHTLGAPALGGELAQIGALAVPSLGHRQHGTARLDNGHRDHLVARAERHTSNTLRRSAHRARMDFREPNRPPIARRDEDLAVTVRNLRGDNCVVVGP